ncbi:hypothetical protein HOP50_11g61390 [Chloropicon primus]|nr:hypothetical protein HOP50_11g61390 [Chloropicon primus]
MEENLSERLEGAAEIAAAGAVAGAMATAAVTAVVNSDATIQSAPEELVKVTGEALLEVAKTVPFVAPVAYLIGAIASSAVTAVTLKADCVEFGKIVQMLEKILLKAENLESHEEVVSDVKDSLEEGLVLMQKMQDRGIIAATFLAKSDRSKFEDLRVRIEEAINRLNLSVSVDTAAITKAKFQQSEELRKKVDELGGADALEKDPDAAQALAEHMEASDQVLNANITAARRSLRAVGDEVAKTSSVIRTIEEQQREHMKETRESVLKTEEQLKEMTSSFLKVQQDAELQRLQNDFLKRQVDELKSMLTEVKDCMTKFPMPAREPERLLVVNNGGFMHLNNEDTVLPKVKEVCMEATQKWNVICQATILDQNTQFTSCGYMPPCVVTETMKDKDKPVECAIDLCGMKVPRKVGMCQHVIAKDEPIMFQNTQGKEDTDNLPPRTTFEDMKQATKTDVKMREFLQRLENNDNVLEWNDKDEETKKILMTYFEGIMNGGDFFYSGVPVQVGGRSVGAFCLLGVHRPPDFGEKDIELQKSMAQRVEMALEQHLQQKQAQAQQAMMMGLQMQQMQMQQQMQAGGMPGMVGVPMAMPMMPMMPMMPQATTAQMPANP